MTTNDMYTAAWTSPSNIALVKYWGKKDGQLPANPSISFTLDKALTETSVKAVRREASDQIRFDFYFEGHKQESFEGKIDTFLKKVTSVFPWLYEFHLEINTSNTFPHSSGIASSASAFSALSLCLCTLHEKITGQPLPDFFRVASYWARIGSGSACRSVYGGYNLWGKTESWEEGHDEYAVNIDHIIHPDFRQFCDTILIVESGRKAVSSSQGHALLKDHLFAEVRYAEARKNIARLLGILKSGDMDGFIQLVESEALMLHSLMMTSATPYILMKPNTLAIIEKIWEYRRQTGTRVLFTLDAGANVHLLNPLVENVKVQDFVKKELLGFCQEDMYFCNAIGKGPVNKDT